MGKKRKQVISPTESPKEPQPTLFQQRLYRVGGSRMP
jgi:hypothetical protein